MKAWFVASHFRYGFDPATTAPMFPAVDTPANATASVVFRSWSNDDPPPPPPSAQATPYGAVESFTRTCPFVHARNRASVRGGIVPCANAGAARSPMASATSARLLNFDKDHHRSGLRVA